jgi:SH3-like domain-containing protein
MTARPTAPLLAAATLALAAFVLPASAQSTAAPVAGNGLAAPAAPGVERLRIADPYLEIRTGPGRGYPIFHVAGRDEWVEVLLRRTDWFKVRSQKGAEGWVQRAQLEATLTEAGAAKSFRDILVDDYLSRRVDAGASWGRFKSEPMLKVWGGWKLSPPFAVEATIGQVQGAFSGTDFWHVDLQVQPWPDQKWSPHASIGFGRLRNVPNLSLVDAVRTDANLAHGQIGVRWHLSDRFMLRADYTLYTAYVSDRRSSEFRAITAGLAFFF